MTGPGLGRALALRRYDVCVVMAGTNDLADPGLRAEEAVGALARLIAAAACACAWRASVATP